MKKVFFTSLAFILASCSDMASGEAEAIAEELPKDFNVAEYVEINPDVKISQIAMDIKLKNDALEPQPNNAVRLATCKSFLSDDELFADIYLNYFNCPAEGWNPEQKCEGQSAFKYSVNNVAYNKENSCNIKGCWSAGFETPYCTQYPTLADCEDAEGPGAYCCTLIGEDKMKSLKENQAKAQNLSSLSLTAPSGQSKGSSSLDTVFVYMCSMFNLIPESGVFDAAAVKAYLNDFWKNKYDPLLTSKHFLMAGRYEGRAYRYCNGDTNGVRTQNMATYIPSKANEYFWDYSVNNETLKPQFFCLNKSDGKVYRIK